MQKSNSAQLTLRKRHPGTTFLGIFTLLALGLYLAALATLTADDLQREARIRITLDPPMLIDAESAPQTAALDRPGRF
ncbi:hypothetical protein C2E25_06085 [Geothermobacter hydrogeniphilus]|uniref:Uncharacterized protein n=1 Tax=Geothermobacter hydrogeniphilus TaxID=1969733 RepID=A0A2K2HBI8_9BACT|nr:hypothetical protein [Geothermobacter hydrogeniphilus]PNU20610.1 hypothetical protein C2E25_06085 [Geothermobacter hydrogeniphilus]